jgi:cyclin-dependent kinase 7
MSHYHVSSQLLDVFISDGVLHLVMEYCPYDLERVIRDKSIMLQAHHVKSYMQMLLRGIECCHSHYVLHRGNVTLNIALYVCKKHSLVYLVVYLFIFY